MPPAHAADAAVEVRVPAQDAWTQTPIDLHVGQSISIEANGSARVVRLTIGEYLFGFDFDRRAGPAGTYLWPRSYAARYAHEAPSAFPLPAIDDGPFPAFGLIGKIGADGPPFYVGARYDGQADRAGRLFLGINDDRPQDNRGAFTARIRLDAAPPPAASPRPVIAPSADGRPLPHARVLMIYVDGLRPDVVHEMARLGFVPTIRRVFLDGGLEVAHAFTTFPSNTLTANGALFTGLFSDRTGIKSQNQFERTTLLPKGQLSEWMPNWLLTHTTSPHRVYDLLDKFAPENTYRFLRQRGIPTLGSRVGQAYRFTILPIAPINPPSRWVHHAQNTIPNPWVAAARIPLYLDEINADYLMDELLGDPEARVISAWFPMTDKVSHSAARGQFGTARRDIAVVDRLLQQILDRLQRIGWARSTYLLLVSDHGHLGGERSPNRHARLAREFFHERLGCNVRVVGQEWTHPGHDPDRFVFLDHQAWGQASIFLPKGRYHRGPWQPNTLAELMAYDLGPNRGRINLLEALTHFMPSTQEPGLPPPVDLVLVKLDASSVLVHRSAENQALIQTRLAGDDTEVYRYQPVRHLHQHADGTLRFEAPLADADPLGYLTDAQVVQQFSESPARDVWLAQPHTAQEWLALTAQTDYPDAVVQIAKCFAWKPPVDDLAPARDPDLIVTAARGWSFRTDETVGTDHGHPLREAMRISLFVAGPNIRSGVLEEPHRIVDVLPTMLDMVQWPYDAAQLDGHAITGIYE